MYCAGDSQFIYEYYKLLIVGNTFKKSAMKTVFNSIDLSQGNELKRYRDTLAEYTGQFDFQFSETCSAALRFKAFSDEKFGFVSFEGTVAAEILCRRPQSRVRGEDAEHYWLQIIVNGQAGFENNGKTCFAQVGDSVLQDPAYYTHIDALFAPKDRSNKMINISIPKQLLAPKTGHIVPHCPIFLDGKQALVSIVNHLGVQIAERSALLSARELTTLMDRFMDLLCETLLSETERREVFGTYHETQFWRMKALIEQRLSDPSLSIHFVANQFNITSRAVQLNFKKHNVRFSTWVRSRRLARAYADLQRTDLVHLSIAEIALRWTFDNPTFFSKVFREEFGETARDVRAKAIELIF